MGGPPVCLQCLKPAKVKIITAVKRELREIVKKNFRKTLVIQQTKGQKVLKLIMVTYRVSNNYCPIRSTNSNELIWQELLDTV